MAKHDWTEFETWHALLDQLCVEAGYLDNMALADKLCETSGNRTQAAYDTAVRNLQNWRQGNHIPQRRNFLLLGKILNVGAEEDLAGHWNRLYAQARSKPTATVASGAGEDTFKDTKPVIPGPRWPLFIGGSLIAATLGAGFVVLTSKINEPTDPVGSFEGVDADYRRDVTMKVGEGTIIHGARGKECGEAPSWEMARKHLPELATGTLNDGGPGTRYSRQCGGRVPARAILFTAKEAGTEQFKLYGDDIVVHVTE